MRKRERYSPAQYEREARRYLAALASRLRPTPVLSVGGFAGMGWLRALPGLLDRERARVGALTAHFYPLDRCEDRRDPDELIEQLLSPQSSRALTATLAPVVDEARRRGLAVRVSEVNSAVCGGVSGVSDTFASALWLADALFALLAAGADEVNVTSGPAPTTRPSRCAPATGG